MAIAVPATWTFVAPARCEPWCWWPALPLAQPRNVVGGQIVSALTGFIVLLVGPPGVWTAAVAGGLALGAMLVLRVSHSPAAATAVIVALQAPPAGRFLALLGLACLILVAVGLVGA
jgi:CBS-domain-containing membrane protein